MEKKGTLVKLLHLLAETVERSTRADFEALLAGRATLMISQPHSTTPREGRAEAALNKRGRPNKDLTGLVTQLRTLGSREDGLNLLKEAQLTKKELEALARLMDLPVPRDDDAERLRQKIVEESIGSRLNSQAIRGQ